MKSPGHQREPFAEQLALQVSWPNTKGKEQIFAPLKPHGYGAHDYPRDNIVLGVLFNYLPYVMIKQVQKSAF